MSEIRLPPLRLNSPNSSDTPRSNTSSLTANLSARERRRQKNSLVRQNSEDRLNSVASETNGRRLPPALRTKTNENGDASAAPRRKPRKPAKSTESEGHKNSGFISDDATRTEDNTVAEQRRSRRPKSTDEADTGEKPKKKHSKRAKAVTANLEFLQGLEEDIVDTNDNETEASKESNRASDNYVSDTGQRALIKQNDFFSNYTHKSMPTDKYYLEMDNKFTIQPKQLYEKRVAMKQQIELEAQIKQKEKDDLRYQILTPKIALKTHKFLRIIFLFIQGINVGTHFWHAVVLFSLNYLNFDLTTTDSVFWFYRNLALPYHCLSYFLLTICIIDIMDKVDFTAMNATYFIKSITVQNPFWCIIFYAVAFVASLSMISVDDTIYLDYLAQEKNATVITQTYQNMSSNMSVWKSLSAVKAAFSMLAWLVFTIFSHYDMTHDSLEKREFSLLDDLAKSNTNNIDSNNTQQNNNTTKTSAVNQTNA